MKKQKRSKKTFNTSKRTFQNTAKPARRTEIQHLLSSEEAKISSQSIIKGAVALFTVGLAVDAMAGAHVNHHVSSGVHTSVAPHNSSDAGHTSLAPHNDGYPHVSVAPHNSVVTPHTNTHASVNEAVTKGTFHNNVTDGYGKHTANVAHNNNPNTHNNTSAHTNTAPHYNYAAHGSSAGHINVGHHMSMAPHFSVAPHNNGHGSHTSHGQW